MNEIQKSAIIAFGEHLRKGAEHLTAACCIYADAVANDHTIAAQFEAAYPYFTGATWDKIRLAGIGAINSRIIMLTDRLGNKLMRMKRADQDRVLADKIPVIRKGKVCKIDACDLSAEEEAVVIAPDFRVRTVAEQRAVLREKAAAKKAAAVRAAEASKTVPYVIQGQMLSVNRACVLSLKELETIVRKMRAGRGN